MPTLSRLSPPRLSDLIDFVKGGNPVDVWNFSFAEVEGTVRNEWRSGAKLYVMGNMVDSNEDFVSVKGTEPVLSYTHGDIQIDVFVRAILSVKLNIAINGEMISDGFV